MGAGVRRARSVTDAADAGRDGSLAHLALDGLDLTDDVDHRVCSPFGGGDRGTQAPLALAPGELGRERVEALAPEPAEVVEPVVQLVERRGVDRIEAACALGPDGREPAVAQDLQVLRHGRLRDAELGLDDRGDRPGRQLAIGEQLQDPASDGVSEDIERVHCPKIQATTYISQYLFIARIRNPQRSRSVRKSMRPILTEPTLATAVTELTARDADLAAVVDRFGPPPLWARPPGFETLTHIILEQQVSLASAQAARDRLVAATDPLTPAAFLRLDDEQLLAIGFSRQKARYIRLLAARLVDGSLDLGALDALDDDDARATLLRADRGRTPGPPTCTC